MLQKSKPVDAEFIETTNTANIEVEFRTEPESNPIPEMVEFYDDKSLIDVLFNMNWDPWKTLKTGFKAPVPQKRTFWAFFETNQFCHG